MLLAEVSSEPRLFRDEIERIAWRGTMFVYDSVTNIIIKLRKALGNASSSAVIQQPDCPLSLCSVSAFPPEKRLWYSSTGLRAGAGRRKRP